MGVGVYQCIWLCYLLVVYFFVLDCLVKVFQVYLVVNIGVWWYYVEVVEGLLFLVQKSVVFVVLFYFQVDVVFEGFVVVEVVNGY